MEGFVLVLFVLSNELLRILIRLHTQVKTLLARVTHQRTHLDLLLNLNRLLFESIGLIKIGTIVVLTDHTRFSAHVAVVTAGGQGFDHVVQGFYS